MRTFEILGKPIRAFQDEEYGTCYSLEDVCKVLGLKDPRTWSHPSNGEIGHGFPTVDIEGVACIKSRNMFAIILVAPNVEARAYLYQHIHGVKKKTIGGAFTSPQVRYDARDLAICLGYANGDRSVIEYFLKQKSLPAYAVHQLAVGSPLPDAEEFVDSLFDDDRLTHLWQHMKFGPRENHIIPFVYKGTIIRTFAEEEEGGFLFTLDDVCMALEIEKAPSLGVGKGLRKTRVVDYYYEKDERGTVLTEAGLDLLLERVGSPEAEEFKRWVARKVLPSLKQPHPWGRPTRLVLQDGRWVPQA